MVVLSMRSWTVERRHVEFKRLQEALSQCGLPLAHVPARGLFGPRSPAALQRRVESLDIWLHGTVASWKSSVPETAEDEASKYMAAFLCNSEEFRHGASAALSASNVRVLRLSITGALRRFFRLTPHTEPASPTRAVTLIPVSSPNSSPHHSSSQERNAYVAESSVHSTTSKSAKLFTYAGSTSTFAASETPNLFHGAVLAQTQDAQGLPRLVVEIRGFDLCAQGFSCVSVPPSPRGRVRFKQSWAAYTDNVLRHAAKCLEAQNAAATSAAATHFADDASWMDSASEGWGSEDEAPNPQVQKQRRAWLEKEMADEDNGNDDGYDSEGWASEAANNSYDGGDSEVYGSWDEGQVWVAPTQRSSHGGDVDVADNAQGEQGDCSGEEHGSSVFDEFTDSELELEEEQGARLLADAAAGSYGDMIGLARLFGADGDSDDE